MLNVSLAAKRTRTVRRSRVALFIFIGLLALLCRAPLASASEEDPFENFNRKIFAFNEFVDRWALKPVAQAYRWITPGFVDKGISNVFDNLGEIRNLVNAGFQGDVAQLAVACGRFLVNSTAGIGGLIDVASRLELPQRDEDFGQTMGRWGVGSGPYLVLPLLGSSSARDVVALVPDFYLAPINYLDDESARHTLRALEIIDLRADLLDAEGLITGDRYTFIREVYLQQRRTDISNGELQDDFDSFEDDF
ncbi:MAG: VacJ family lipoprotein [Pseudomonadales bacterium]|nr:VacJ family lipoprotein [Gammaproteobacteria bacterium]NNL56256.1 VacJ family lipoprotein [Pseudomonadales bacterium]